MKNDVAIYLRKSREDDELKEETLARHETMLLDYCKRNNLNIVKIYKEVVSGESIANRPQMQRLLDDVSKGLYAGVVCIEIERLSRGNQIDQVEILEIFKSSGTKIYTLNKIYDLSKEDIDEEFLEFALFMSRREYKIINRRLQRGRNQSRQEGYYIGSILPFGFDKIRGERGYILVPNDNAKVVEFIFNQYLDGVNVATITNYLNDNGIKPQNHNKIWTPPTVRNVLKNKLYIGMINTNNRGGTVKGKHEPIIDELTFNRVQEQLAKTPKVTNRRKLSNPLAGLVYCSECGRTMIRKINALKFEYITCPSLKCNTRSLKLETLESILLDELKKELKGFNYFLDNYGEQIKTEKEKVAVELAILETELEKKLNMIETACEMLEAGIYTKELFTRRISVLEDDIKAIKENISNIKNTPLEDDTRAYKAIPILEKVLEKYNNLDAKEKNLLLKSIVERVEFTRLEHDTSLNITLLL